MEDNFSQMIQDNADCLEAISKKYLLTNGASVKSDIAEYERRKKEVDKDIRRIVGDREFEAYKRESAHSDSVRDENFYRLAISKLRINTMKSREDDESSSAALAIDSDVLQSASVLSDDLSNGEITGKSMENKLDFLDTMAEHCNRQIDESENLTDEQKKTEKGKVSAAVLAQKTLYSDDAVAKMQKVYTNRTKIAEEQAKRLVETTQKNFADSMEFWAKCNSDGETAFANSAASCKKFAKQYFGERIARGQEFEVLAQLDYLQKASDYAFRESKKVKRVDANGKPILDKDGNEQYDLTGEGKYEPFRTLYLRADDIAKIRADANSVIARRKQERKMREKEDREETLKYANTLKNETKYYSLGINPSNGRPFASSDEREQFKKVLLEKANNLRIKGFEQSGELLDEIFKGPEREEKARQKQQNFVAKQLAKRNVAAMEEAIKNEIVRLASNDGMKYVDELELEDANGKIVKTKVELDATRAISTLIHEAQLVGICQGPFFTNMKNRFDGAEKNCKIVENVLNKVLKYPTTGTQKRMKDNGKIGWGDRPESDGEYIMLKLGENATFRVSNVGAGNKVIAQQEVFKLFGSNTPELAIDSDTLEKVANLGRRYLEREMENATEEGLTDVISTALERAKQKGDQKSFGMDFVKHLEGMIESRFKAIPSIQSPLNPYIVSPARAGAPDFDKLRYVMPLVSSIRTKQAINDILLASQPDDKEEAELEAKFGGGGTEE